MAAVDNAIIQGHIFKRKEEECVVYLKKNQKKKIREVMIGGDLVKLFGFIGVMGLRLHDFS
jgi:hypothetical protein